MSRLQALRGQWPRYRAAIGMALVASLTLGLAPFFPHPHVYKQLVNLFQGRLREPIDIFDLVLHGAPWLWLAWTLTSWVRAARRGGA